jgi:alpha-galactosidase
MSRRILVLLLGVACGIGSIAMASASAGEIDAVQRWVTEVCSRPSAARLEAGRDLSCTAGGLSVAALPDNHSAALFSFTYGGKPSEVVLQTWQYSDHSESRQNSVRRTETYRCPKTGLRLISQVTTYADAAAVDWVLYLANEGRVATPIIESLMPLDLPILDARPDQAINLRWSNGDSCSPESFLPHDEPLHVNQVRRFAPLGGRSSNTTALPFFNALGPEYGCVLAVGWSGQWAAEFRRQTNGSLRVRAGMETTRFRLQPGQSVRSPRIVLLRYRSKEMIAGHNQFRQLMLKHYVPCRDGRPAIPPICHNTAATVYRSGRAATETNQLAIIRKAAQLGNEAYWMDAYWYPQPWDSNAGNWYPRPADFPRGLRPLSEAAHQAGMKFVLWFEPERVWPGTNFDRQHPELLLKVDQSGPRLFNLADGKARQVLTDFLDQRIKQWGVDIYRQDFNIDPLAFWQKNDPLDGRGLTEMRYVDGLYQMWAELLRRNPRLAIDNCASGGRRVDIETCALSCPLWRSDFNDIGEGLKGPSYWPNMARADQVHVAGLSLYVPFHAGPVWDMHPYSVRSAMTSCVVFYERILHAEFPNDLARKAVVEIKQLRPLFLGNIYPLSPLTTSQKDWYVYQLHRPDLREGCVLAFRRPESPEVSRQIELKEIDPRATYEVILTGETYDQGNPQLIEGRELMRTTVRIDAKPGSCLLRYKRAALDHRAGRNPCPHLPHALSARPRRRDLRRQTEPHIAAALCDDDAAAAPGAAAGVDRPRR